MAFIHRKYLERGLALASDPGSNRITQDIPIINNVIGCEVHWFYRPALTADPGTVILVDNGNTGLTANGDTTITGIAENPTGTFLTLPCKDYMTSEVYTTGDYNMSRSWMNTFTVTRFDFQLCDSTGTPVTLAGADSVRLFLRFYVDPTPR